RNILLDGALNNMSQGLNMFDSAGVLVLSNARYIEMYGLTRETVKPGVTVRELVDARVKAGTFFKTDPEQYAKELLDSIVERRGTRVTRELVDGRDINASNEALDTAAV